MAVHVAEPQLSSNRPSVLAVKTIDQSWETIFTFIGVLGCSGAEINEIGLL